MTAIYNKLINNTHLNVSTISVLLGQTTLILNHTLSYPSNFPLLHKVVLGVHKFVYFIAAMKASLISFLIKKKSLLLHADSYKALTHEISVNIK